MIRALALACLGLFSGPLALGAAPPSSMGGVSIGVAPFEVVAAPTASLPDFAALLADRLKSLGAARVVGPSEVSGALAAELDAEQVRAWAERAAVASVVIGRTTQSGERFSLDVQLLSGTSGGLVEAYGAEIPTADEVESVLDRLAAELIQGAAALAVAPPAAPAPGSGPGEKDEQSRFGVSIDRTQPLSIRSEELEAIRSDGARRLIFTEDVQVTQADVQIRTDRLEAFYPPRANQPDRLIATGHVVLTQGDREARCNQATYHRAQQSLVCRGDAELRDGDDRVQGDVIQFDLAGDTVLVTGGAALELQPRPEDLAEEGAPNP